MTPPRDFGSTRSGQAMTPGPCFPLLPVLLTALALLLSGAPATAMEIRLRLLDHLVVSAQTHPDLALREISALAWDKEAQILLAVSDRNDVYSLSLGPDPDRIEPTLRVRHRLLDEEGQRLRRRDFSAEGAASADPRMGVIAILSEMQPQLAIFDRAGQRLDVLSLPADLRDSSRLRSESDGLESLAHHPALGYLFAPQEPLAGQPRRVHVIWGKDGPVLAFHTGAAGSTDIKSMETLPDGRLLILERDRLDAQTVATFLRLLDPADCPAVDPCISEAIALDLPPPFDADFEGMTLIGDNRLILASDDRIGGQPRTVFVLLDMVVAED